MPKGKKKVLRRRKKAVLSIPQNLTPEEAQKLFGVSPASPTLNLHTALGGKVGLPNGQQSDIIKGQILGNYTEVNIFFK
jgi:hypothetical protein